MSRDVKFVDANGLRFGYLESGMGPLVLLVHGFPDTAHSWDATRPALAAAGFRAVAPFTRGYAPTEIPKEEAYDSDTLGRDLLALIRALGGAPAVVVGHDWGASAAYSAAALDPDALRLLVTVAIPHPASVTPTPSAIWAVRHFFSLRRLVHERSGALRWMPKNDFAHVDELVHRWSPKWDVPPGETDAVKAIFRNPANLDAALGYYRALRPGRRARIGRRSACRRSASAATATCCRSPPKSAPARASPARTRSCRCRAATSCTASTRRSSTRSCWPCWSEREAADPTSMQTSP